VALSASGHHAPGGARPDREAPVPGACGVKERGAHAPFLIVRLFVRDETPCAHLHREAGGIRVAEPEAKPVRTTRLSAISASVGVPPEVSTTTAAENVTVAWASTVHAFQYRTFDTVIAAMEANHPNLTNQKTHYVEISRARDRAKLVTDDAKALRERLEAATGGRITALEAFGDNPRDARRTK